ncbi:hypothetical protein N7466_006487 [Penicillium verhagenii]|uniref:uncharacterized protein n=1 Tax=Penicillium verhagenii TaxID=1562060 RepID=UPI0025453ED6|nr:uncharacterized protein N7466_006487 [Penicillium verhagenii]KAJ5930994.1 hypothetical protein N7466_006487 [Penicillium verhagenii]
MAFHERNFEHTSSDLPDNTGYEMAPDALNHYVDIPWRQMQPEWLQVGPTTVNRSYDVADSRIDLGSQWLSSHDTRQYTHGSYNAFRHGLSASQGHVTGEQSSSNQPFENGYNFASQVSATRRQAGPGPSSNTQINTWDSHLDMTIEAGQIMQQQKVLPSRTYRCLWQGCRYTGTFRRSAELRRHVDTQHIAPKSYICPVSDCGRPYNRGDNLNEHLRRAHGSNF